MTPSLRRLQAMGDLRAAARWLAPAAQDVAWSWEAGAGTYRNASAPVRAALMNGFSQARDLGPVARRIAPTEADRIATPARDPLPPAVALARAMTEAMTEAARRAVAQADYGIDMACHPAALNAVLDRPDCRMHEDEYRHPSEVVELTSHAPGSEGFTPCTALLMTQAIHDNDMMDDMSFRWGSNFPTYGSPEEAVSKPLLNGFRHLHEVDQGVGPAHHGQPFDPHSLIPRFEP